VLHITCTLSNTVYTIALRHTEQFLQHGGWKQMRFGIIAST